MTRFRRTAVLAVLLLTAAGAQGAALTVRDPAFGLPHFYGDTDAELARENGRQIARDRLVQMILLSRAGRGTLYQPFGVLDASTLNDDIEARRTAYTSSELYSMFEKFPPAERTAVLEYCKGVNDTVDQIYAGTLPEPLEVNILRNVLSLGLDLFGTKNNISDQTDPCYAPPGVPPNCYGITTSEWPNAGFQFTPESVVAVAILEVRNFGINAFDEATLLAQLQSMTAKHGAVAGAEMWDDLNYLNDPLAPVSVPDPTTPGYGGPLAMAPRSPTRLAAVGERFPSYDYAGAMQQIAEAKAHRAEFAIRLGAWPMLGSYGWIIAGGKTATGYPWLGGFPQTGIQTPSLMHYAEIRSGEGADHRIQANGMEFAGAGPVILIGHTDSVAYTTTTAQLRIIDTFF
jgi:penicillin G amidase